MLVSIVSCRPADKFNPNGKIPVIVDPNFHAADGSEFTVIESGAILVHLAENYGNGRFLPKDPVGRSLAIQWCFWQMSGLGPIMGQYFHFAKFASEKIPYAVTRYTNETVRLLHVLETRLSTTGAYLGGAEYSIADIATYPWVRVFLSFTQQDEIVKAESFPNILRWHEKIAKRPAVVKGLTVLPM